MRVMRALVCAVGVVLSACYAEKARYTYDEIGNPTIWQESKVRLPAFPEEANLIRFTAPVGSGRNQYFVDRASIALGADRVIRYTVVVRSPTGVENTIYEGLACDVREVKTYAHGNSKRQFSMRSNPTWGRISHRGVKGYQGVLATRFMCDDSHGYLDAEGALERLEAARSVDGAQAGESGDDNN